MAMHTHSTHPEIIKRLKRAAGHLSKVIHMIEQEQGCLEIAQQLQAVEGAITKAKKILIHDHIDHCLEETTPDHASVHMNEFKEITKYL
jgi:DNA-binding FrmR family transcriptional regulator